MSLRQLVEPDCGGMNPAMQFANQLTKDVAYKDENFYQRQLPLDSVQSSSKFEEEQLVNEYLSKVTTLPQTFQMDALLKEMREIEAQDFHSSVVNSAPRVIDEVTKNDLWTTEFFNKKQTLIAQPTNSMMNSNIIPKLEQNEAWNLPKDDTSNAHIENGICVKEFFDANQNNEEYVVGAGTSFIPTLQPNFFIPQNPPQNETISSVNNPPRVQLNDWLEDFSKNMTEEMEETARTQDKYWKNLQDEWRKLSEEEVTDNSWLSLPEFYFDPYKEYQFLEQNAMKDDINALEKGKEFLEKGDIPNAVLCFEAAVRQNSENAEAWELLGISQAENEMDPHAIAALRKSLELNPNNMKVLMALAVSYTNESLQSQAIKMLTAWLQNNPKYANLIEKNNLKNKTNSDIAITSLVPNMELLEIQNLFLEAVAQNHNEVDPDIQEALGVLFTLSYEYDKAADCFRAALQIRPDNSKTWNRLGASLANGSRPTEAVEAYQRALEISPGFIRARYNVGIVCMNLKAYKEAAEHLLVALNLQATSVSRSGLKEFQTSKLESETIWSTLRMIVSLMGKWELQEIIDKRDLVAINKHFGDSE